MSNFLGIPIDSETINAIAELDKNNRRLAFLVDAASYFALTNPEKSSNDFYEAIDDTIISLCLITQTNSESLLVDFLPMLGTINSDLSNLLNQQITVISNQSFLGFDLTIRQVNTIRALSKQSQILNLLADAITYYSERYPNATILNFKESVSQTLDNLCDSFGLTIEAPISLLLPLLKQLIKSIDVLAQRS